MAHLIPVSYFFAVKRNKTVSLLVAFLFCAALLVAYTLRRPALQPTMVPRLDRLDPQLRAYLSYRIGEVLKQPRKEQTHRDLAMAYSANGLWNPAKEEFQ